MKIKGFLMRLICLPFVFALFVIACTYKIFYGSFCYLFYGGELVSYMKNDTVLMADVYQHAKTHMQNAKD